MMAKFDIDTPVQGAFDTESRPPGAVDDPNIEPMIEDLLTRTSGSFYDFIMDLYAWYQEHGWLTVKQYNALLNAYECRTRFPAEEEDWWDDWRNWRDDD